MPAMKKRKADGPVVVNVDTSAPRRTYKKKGTYARRASSNWKSFSKLKPWSDFGAMRYPRGTAEGISRFGQTYMDATPEQRMERAAVGWRGRGLYTGDGAYNPAKRFREWATGAARNLGRGVGKQLNYNLNQQLASMSTPAPMYTGEGLYSGAGLYNSNVLVHGDGMRQPMEFSSPNDETQSLVICHKEYVGDVFGPSSTAFVNTVYPIQPGLSQFYPFLAQFSQNFDEYELIQMVWEFHSTVDPSSTSNAAGNTGTIVMATNYKADSPSFQTKEEMIQYHGGVSGRLTEQLVHGVECDDTKGALAGGKFIRTATVNSSDIKTFDVGNFQLAIQNCPTPFQNQQVGELWVYYKVKLSKPKLFTALGNGGSEFRAVSAGGETQTLPMGTNILKAQANSLSCAIVTANKGVTITFPAAVSGCYEARILTEGSVISNTGTYFSFAGQITPFSDMYGGVTVASTLGVADNPSSIVVCHQANQGLVIFRFVVRSASASTDNSVTLYPFGDTGTATTITQCAVEVREIGTSFATSNLVSRPVFLNAVGTITDPVITSS